MAGESLLSGLHTRRSDWKIVVKVMKRWETINPGDLRWIDFILVDEEGSKILASVADLYHAYFKRVMQEGSWFEISGFHVRRSNIENTSLSMTRSDYSILFHNYTRVQPVDVVSNNHNMDFADFEYVAQISCNGLYPIDLMGVIESVEPLRQYMNNGSLKNYVKFRIKNYSDVVFDCLAVGELAEKFHQEWCLAPKEEIVVCVLNDWEVTNLGGSTLIRDGGGISRFYFEPDFHEVRTFRYIHSLNEKAKKIAAEKSPSQ